MIDPERIWTKERIAATTQAEVEAMAEAITQDVEDRFRGKNPQAVGLALGFLVAKWVAGHQSDAHNRLMQCFIGLVNDAVPGMHEKLFAGAVTRQ